MVITYYTNFAKSGYCFFCTISKFQKLTLLFFKRNPNIGEKVNRIWEPYTNNKAYLKLNNDLLKASSDGSLAQIHYGVRDDLYNFWFVEMKKDSNCTYSKTDNGYESKYETKKNRAINKCIEKLNESADYLHLKDMFLIEYENCMNTIEQNVPPLKNVFNTFCLDIIIIRRLLIEYSVCCNQNETEITSTICSMKNLDPKYAKYNISNLISYAIKQSVVSSTTPNQASHNRVETFSCFLFILTFKYIFMYF